MSKAANAFFEIHINGELANHTPVTIMNGVLHCVEISGGVAGAGAGAVQFLPVAYYNEPTITITSVNSLRSVRQHPFDFTSNGLGATLDLTTDVLHVRKDATAGVTVVSVPPVNYEMCQLTLNKLALNPIAKLEGVSAYNDVDSDVVLTTATPTAWNRPYRPGDVRITLKSNVLELVYSALYAQVPDPTRYVLLANADGADYPTVVWTFNPAHPATSAYDRASGVFSFDSHVLTERIVDQMLDGIAPDLLQRNDTIDVTVNTDERASSVYTARLYYSGTSDDHQPRPYGDYLFHGLLDKNPTAYVNKQAICVAVAKYNQGRGVDTTAFPPFQFRYQQSTKISVLDEVALDFQTYYYVVYHFAPTASPAVFTFPTLVQTTRSVPVVTLGQPLTLTAHFSQAFPANTAARATVRPKGRSAVEHAAIIVDRTVVFSHTVQYDALHAGEVTVVYGKASQTYALDARTLTSAHIYTFPSGFSYAGWGGARPSDPLLTQKRPGHLALHFYGGDRLFSSVVAKQVEYVKYEQSALETVIDASGSLRCFDASGVIVVTGIAPSEKSDLILKVRLRGPDGTLGDEMTQTIPASSIAPDWMPPSSIVAVLAFRDATSGPDYDVRRFAAAQTYPSPTASPMALTLTLQWDDPSKVGRVQIDDVRAYIGEASSGWVRVEYTFDQMTKQVRVTSMTLGELTGPLAFCVNMTLQNAAKLELRTTGHTVHAVPDRVTIATIGDGFALVAKHAVSTTFVFGHSIATLDRALEGLEAGSSSALLEVSGGSVSISPSFAVGRSLGSIVTATSSDTQTITFTLASTRTTVACVVPASAIYTFPGVATCAVASDGGSSGGQIVTIGKVATLTWTFDTALPVGATHAVASTNAATYTTATASPMAQRSLSVAYKLTPTAKQNIDSTVTVTFGGVSVPYTVTHALLASSVYVPPTGLRAVVSFSTGLAADTGIASLALGAQYGTSAGSTVCGAGNTSSIVLTLTGIDAETPNTAEIAADGGAVACVDASGLSAYGTIPTYTYADATHSASIGLFALADAAPASGYVQFAVVVASPDGYTTTLRTAPLAVVNTPTACAAGVLASSVYACVDGSTVPVPYTLSGTGTLGAGYASGASVATAIDSVSGPGLTFAALSGNFAGGGRFTLDTTYAGVSGSITATLIMASTRARVTCAMQAFKFPTSVAFSQSPLVIGTTTSIAATVNTSTCAGTAWTMSASSGTVTGGSATTVSPGATVTFDFTPASSIAATGTLRLTWATLTRTIQATLPQPTITSTPTLSSTQFNVGTLFTGEFTLSGPGTQAISASDISVYMNTSSIPVSNGAVTNYSTATRAVSFTATPTVHGMNRLYARIMLRVDGSVWPTTLTMTGSTPQGYFVDASGSTYTMPTSFTLSPTTGYIEGASATMAIAATGADAAIAPLAVYYAATSGAVSPESVTQCGVGTLSAGTANVPVTAPPGTWYAYIRATSPLGASGPIVGSAETFTVRAYVHATSIVSHPTVVVEGSTTAMSATFAGYETGVAGTAALYHAATSSHVAPMLLGAGPMVAGAVSVDRCTVPTSAFYLYARTISPTSVQGPLLVSMQQVTTRAYVMPTSVTCLASALSTNGTQTVPLVFAPADGLASATVRVYYHTTSALAPSTSSPSPLLQALDALAPVQCGTGTVDPTGVASASCTFPTIGVFYIYASVVAPNGAVGSLLCDTSKSVVISGASYILDGSKMLVSDGFWSGVQSTNWNFASVTANMLKPVQPDVAGDYALMASGVPIASKMFAANTTEWVGSRPTTVGTNFLLFIGNETYLGNLMLHSPSAEVKINGVSLLSPSTRIAFQPDTTGALTFASAYASSIQAAYFNGVPLIKSGDSFAATTIGPLPAAKGLFINQPGTTISPYHNGVVGGLNWADYALHVQLKASASVEIAGFSSLPNWPSITMPNADGQDTDVRLRSRLGTDARLPRFGALNAYVYGGSIEAFVDETRAYVKSFGVSMYEPTAVATTLAVAYGMHVDVSRAVAFYQRCGMLVGAGDTNVVYSASTGYPPSPNFNARELPSYSASSLLPTAVNSLPWPWRGYSVPPSGYFGDPVTGLCAVGSKVDSLPTVTIKTSAAGLPYLRIDPAGKEWQLGSVPSEFGADVWFNGARFDARVEARMVQSAAQIKYTAVSWVGSVFHNTACFKSTRGQSLLWNGFYCTPAVGGGPAVLSGITGAYIVWDFTAACESAMQSPSGSVVQNTGVVSNKNVIAWVPLAGTSPTDRETMHVFTLRIDNTVNGTNGATPANIVESNVDQWVALYQNGVRLVRATTIAASKLYASKVTGVGGSYVLPNALLSSAVNGASIFTTAKGASHANALATVGASTTWNFAENNVSAKETKYTDDDVRVIAMGLCSKWGIVPTLSLAPGASGNFLELFVTGVTGTFAIERVGLFATAAKAAGGSTADDLAITGSASPTSMLGFSNVADWTTSSVLVRDATTRGSFVVSGTGATGALLAGTGYAHVAGSVPGATYVRMSMRFSGTASNAPNIRMYAKLTHSGVAAWYGLGFGYYGLMYNSATSALFDSDATALHGGIFQFVRSAVDLSQAAWTNTGAWTNPYVPALDLGDIGAYTVDSSSFRFSSDADGASATDFRVPRGFTSTGAPSDIGHIKSYHRDVKGEWAPSGTKMTTKMMRVEFDAPRTMNIRVKASGYAAILVQCHVYYNMNPSIQWWATPSGGARTAMATANTEAPGPGYPPNSTYLVPYDHARHDRSFNPMYPFNDVLWTGGLDSTSDFVSKTTQVATAVRFAKSTLPGETRAYNGFWGGTDPTNVYHTTTPNLGVSGDVMLQDFITIHRFGTLTECEFECINNVNRWPTDVASGTPIRGAGTRQTPYGVTTSTNTCGGARFGSFAVIPTQMTEEDLQSAGCDIANKFFIPYAGPSIHKLRIRNVGADAVSIGYVDMSKKAMHFDVDQVYFEQSLMTQVAARSVSSGSLSATWSNTMTFSSEPFQVIPAGAYMEFVFTGQRYDVSFLQIARVTTAGATAKLGVEILSSSSATKWEMYDLWYHYNGSAVNASVDNVAPGYTSNTEPYAKLGVFTLWKRLYRSPPFNPPSYQMAFESNSDYLASISSKLLTTTWDGDRAIKYYLANASAGSFTENQVLVFKQHAQGTSFSRLGGSAVLAQVEALATKTGTYNLTTIEHTRLDYLPPAISRQFGGVFFREMLGDNPPNSSHSMFCMDPDTLHSPFSANLYAHNRAPVNLRLRKSLTQRWYTDLPQLLGSAGVQELGINGVATGRTYTASDSPSAWPQHAIGLNARTMCGYSAFSLLCSQTMDRLDMTKRFSVTSWICNANAMFFWMNGFQSGIEQGGVTGLYAFQNNWNSGSCLTESITSNVTTECTMQVLNAMGYVGTWAKYRALRTLSTHGSGWNDGVTYPNNPNSTSVSSSERLYLVTYAVDTYRSGSEIRSDADFQNYVRVYINGKAINTSSRRTAPSTFSWGGWGYFPETNYDGIYQSCLKNYRDSRVFNSAPLVHRITMAGCENKTEGSGALRLLSKKNMLGGPNVVSALKQYGSDSNSINTIGLSVAPTGASTNDTCRYYKPYSRIIIMESKMDCRASVKYTDAEIATHITALADKWGLPLAYRWVTVTNTGSVAFSFKRLGFYASHAEAYADSTGSAVDSKTGANLNVMKDYTGASPYQIAITSTLSSTALSSLTAVLSGTSNDAPATNEGIQIQVGGHIKIDLGDPITCSHIRLGAFSSSDPGSVRMRMRLTATKFADETQGSEYECKVQAAKNASGPGEGQFPMHSPTVVASSTAFLNSDGTHRNTCGIYVLVPDYSTLVSNFF